MKTTVQIKTGDFEYIMQEYDVELTSEQAVGAYYALQKAYNLPKDGLTAKEVDYLLDCYFVGQGIDSNLFDKRNPEQDKWFQAIKRSLKRIKHASDDIEG